MDVLLGQVDKLLTHEENIDCAACPVDKMMPKAVFLMLRMQRASLRQQTKKYRTAIAGGVTGFGTFVLVSAHLLGRWKGWW